MSGWDAFTAQLVQTGKVKRAGIFGLDGSAWTVSPGFGVAPEEVKKCVAAIKEKKSDALSASGIKSNDMKFFFLSLDGNVIMGRKGPDGVIVHKANGSVVIGTYGEGMQPADCNTAIGKMVEYLNSTGS